MKTTATKRGRASPAFVFSALCFCLVAVLLTSAYVMSTRALSVVPSPRGQPPPEVTTQQGQAGPEQAEEEDPFPVVDWDYWQSINPAIVGWVTVPDTGIDYAVVQAPIQDPTFYLYHDIFDDWNPYGCPYADAACTGTTGFNTVIFGHNMGYDSTMFGDFANYSDPSFAEAHPQILFQTPKEKLVLDVSAASVVRGTEQSKRTEFTTQQELSLWYVQEYEKASMQVSNDPRATRLFTFVTCSYNFYSNERTLVFAQPHNN